MHGYSCAWDRWRSYMVFTLVATSYFLVMSGWLGHPPRDCVRDLMLIAYGIGFHLLVEQTYSDAN